MENQKIAEFIFGMADAGVASELPEQEQIEMIIEDLEAIKDTSLYYYLSCACEHHGFIQNKKKS